MIRAAIILILSLAAARAADEPKPLIQSAEQAVLRFREVRDTQLKSALSERLFKALVPGIGAAGYLTVRPMQPRDYQPPYSDGIVRTATKGAIFGTFAAAAETKHDTWRLNYGTASLPGVVIYLDAVTGDILYINELPEG